MTRTAALRNLTIHANRQRCLSFSTTKYRRSSHSEAPIQNDNLPIISPADLVNLINVARAPVFTSPRLVLVDASWFMPNDPKKRTGQSSFDQIRISNDARFFDLDVVKSETSPYPHMLPTARKFAEAMRKLQIRRNDAAIIYESPELGIFSAPRVAWTLKVFRHPIVMILNNFKLWVNEGYTVEKGDHDKGTISSLSKEEEYPVVEPDLDLVAPFEEVHDVAKKHPSNVQILDARPHGRFTGEDPEPRPGLSSGHVPNSLSVPFGTLLDPNTRAFLPKPELRQVLLQAGVSEDPEVQKISMCGTGVTATIVDTALQIAGFGETPKSKRKVYDGSWTEWAQRVKDEPGMIVKS